MIKTTVLPKETLSELLLFIAENEDFNSISKKLRSGVSVEETRSALRELAGELAREAAIEQKSLESSDAGSEVTFSPKVKGILSHLSPQEKKALFTAFGLSE